MEWTDIEGWFLPVQGDILQLFCKDRIYLEIGSYKGRSTICAAEVAQQVYAVDTFKAKKDGQTQHERFTTLDEFEQNISGYKNIKYYVGESTKIADEFKEHSIDIIFIDGMHDYESVISDKENWWPKLKVGGYMIFHDYSKGCQVKDAVNDIFPKDEIASQFCVAWIRKS